MILRGSGDRTFLPRRSTMPIVEADRELCTGSGMCVRIAPDVFDQDPVEGLVVVLVADVAADASDRVQEAIAQCPVAALSLAGDALESSESEEGV
jgi:ferredoxin